MQTVSFHDQEINLNSPDKRTRLDALEYLAHANQQGEAFLPKAHRDVNNHIHTTYSFSPYSPTKAVWMAAKAGLATAGIMDHDSISGAREFIEAGAILNLPITIGTECRASFADTSLNGRRLNNPDQDTVAYIAFHGVPHNRIDALDAFLLPIRQARTLRNRQMTLRLAELLSSGGISLDYDKDVLPLSLYAQGGEVTERHLLYAVSLKLLARFGPTTSLVEWLKDDLGLNLSPKAENLLTDPQNPHVAYDLLGFLKSDLVEKFYIPAEGAECPKIQEVSAFAKANNIILAYPYLGDVTSSVTGDKKAQTFEDSFLPELFAVIKDLGFTAVTYMPSRNTREQMLRLKELCKQYDFFQISGEDINQPRQAFICEAMRDPLFDNLYDAAWALIGHERLATKDPNAGLFSAATCARLPKLEDRITEYRDKALALYHKA